MRWYAVGAMNKIDARAVARRIPKYRSRWKGDSVSNRWLNGTVRRKANSTWTPGRATRSSWSSSPSSRSSRSAFDSSDMSESDRPPGRPVREVVRAVLPARDVAQLALDLVHRLAGLLLDRSDDLIPLPLGPVEVVIGERAPGLLDPAAHLVPLALELQALVGGVSHGNLLPSGPWSTRGAGPSNGAAREVTERGHVSGVLGLTAPCLDQNRRRADQRIGQHGSEPGLPDRAPAGVLVAVPGGVTSVYGAVCGGVRAT